jgi:hypothetical protein
MLGLLMHTDTPFLIYSLKASPAFQSHQARERRVVVLTCAFALLALLAFICTTSLVATSAAGTPRPLLLELKVRF